VEGKRMSGEKRDERGGEKRRGKGEEEQGMTEEERDSTEQRTEGKKRVENLDRAETSYWTEKREERERKRT
jgi:hypothetical protein